MIKSIDSLDSVVQMIPLLKSAIPADLSIAVCNLEEFIAYFPGENINLHIKVGQKIHPEEPLAVAIQQNRRLQADVPEEFYGFEFVGTAMPLINNRNQVIGGMAVQIRKQSELRANIAQITEALSEAKQQIGTVVEGSNSLADLSQELLSQSNKAGESVKETDNVLSMIKKVADQTNLLGLNAAIEAARAGEKGKGFEIVANEIRKLSKETVTSTKKVSEITAHIQKATNQMEVSIEKIAAVGNDQAMSLQHIASLVDEIEKFSKELNEFVHKL